MVAARTLQSAVALPLRPSARAVRLQNDETAMQLRLEQTQQNGTKAASSLPPPLCVQALPTSSWLLNASNPGYSLSVCMSCRSRMIQTLCISFRDECVSMSTRTSAYPVSSNRSRMAGNLWDAARAVWTPCARGDRS